MKEQYTSPQGRGHGEIIERWF